MKSIFFGVLFFFSNNVFSAIDVVVHPSNESNLTKNEITRIFMGKVKSFSSGEQAVPISQIESSNVATEFNSTVLNRSNSQLKAYWSKLVFTGKGTPPRAVNSDAEVIKLIAKNPNMIGFVSQGKADASVKVVGTF